MNISQKSRDVLEILHQNIAKGFTVHLDETRTTDDAEAFLLDILDVLCQDNIVEYHKLQTLVILQEQIEWAVLNVTSAEHVIGSLKNMYLYPAGNDSQFYKCQLLITLTSVLIMSSSKLQNLQENCETLHSSIQFLTDIICKVNHQPSALIRKTACECLWEIELSYPGLLQDRLGNFFKICDEERSVIFQSYMLLFITTLKDAIVHLSTFHEKFPENPNYLNELLSNETDLSMKVNYLFEFGAIQDQFPVLLNVGSSNLFDVTLPSKFKNKEVKRVVSYIVENCHLLTNMPLFHILAQLMHCIKLSGLSLSIFKAHYVNNLSAMNDLPLFQLVLLLMSTFGNQLFEETDSIILLQRLSNLSNQPDLQIGERLLCYKWLIDLPFKSQAGRSLIELMDFTQKANFHPTVFDSLEIIPGKLDVLSSCYFPGDGPDIATATLMNCLVCLLEPIKHKRKRPYAAMLFQVLFSYYSRHHDTALVQEIYKFLLSFVTEHPDLVPYILDYTFAVSQLTPDSFLPSEVLRSFTDYIVALPLKSQLKNIRNYLKAFEFAMKLKDISPTSTVRYLSELVKAEEMYRSHAWSVGNAILLVCRNILQYHDTSKIITELGDCLLAINQVYSDVDICDRAMFYFSLLTSISTEKCSKLLIGTLTKVGQSGMPYAHSDITTPSITLSLPIKESPKSFLSLTRHLKRNLLIESPVFEDCSADAESFDGYLSSYHKQLDKDADKMCVPFSFYFHYNTEPNDEVPDTIFAVVIQFHTSSNYNKIPDIHVPYLSYHNSNKPSQGCQVVEVKFSPVEPVPAVIDVRVIFSSTTGRSFIVSLKPIVLSFPDLFIPLGQQTVCLPNIKHTKSPELLFDILWTHIEDHQFCRQNPEFTGAKSIMYLESRDVMEMIVKQLEGHIIRECDGELLAGVVLPPKHHLLFRFVTHETHTVVYIETDRWQVLGLVAQFLNMNQEELH